MPRPQIEAGSLTHPALLRPEDCTQHVCFKEPGDTQAALCEFPRQQCDFKERRNLQLESEPLPALGATQFPPVTVSLPVR